MMSVPNANEDLSFENGTGDVSRQNKDEDQEIQQENESQEIQRVHEYERNIQRTPNLTLPSPSRTNISDETDDVLYYKPSYQNNSQQSDKIFVEVNKQTDQSPFKKYLFSP